VPDFVTSLLASQSDYDLSLIRSDKDLETLVKHTSRFHQTHGFLMATSYTQRRLCTSMTLSVTNFDSGRHEGRCSFCGVDHCWL
jgi:hypothetical protein